MGDVRVVPQPWLWRPRTKSIRFIEIHSTRGNTTPEKQKQAALNWVMSPNNVAASGGWGSSFSVVIGTDGSAGFVLNDNQMPTYSAGYGGPGSEWAIDEYGISLELAQSAQQEPFTDACLRRAAKITAAKCVQYGIPAEFKYIPQQYGPVPTGIVRHDKCQNGIFLGKSDPGNQFNEQYFISLVDAQMEPKEVNMALDRETDKEMFRKMFRDLVVRGDLGPLTIPGDDQDRRFRNAWSEAALDSGVQEAIDKASGTYTDEQAVAAVKAALPD